ncbi:MAG: ferritin-like domain-containing protein [Sandaracinaceae bacterium]
MISLVSSGSVLDRFAFDLDAQGPSLGTPDLSGASPDELATARLAWASRVIDEYRSVVVFGELFGRLAAIEAPYVTLAAVHRLIGDELRHARMCLQIAGWFGPIDGLEIDLRDLGLPPTDAPHAVRALEIIARELMVAEGESVRTLAAYRNATSDPACRDALSSILRDEARHAASGPALFDAVRAHAERGPHRGAVARRLGSLERTMDEDRAHIRAVHAEAARHDGAARYGAALRADEAPCMRG